MLGRLRSLEPLFIRGVAPALAIGFIAIGLRVSSSAPAVTAAAATAVSLSALATGLFLHGRHHGRRWQVLWVVLATSLLVLTVATTRVAVSGLPTSYPAGIDVVGVVCGVMVVLALGGLVSMRARGCGIDAMLEGALFTCVCAYFPWVWAVAHGMDQRHALAVLMPVAVWVVALWMLLRLLFLTAEHIVAYRYLALAFLCLVVSNAILAGTRLGGGAIDRSNGFGIVLWAYCAWGTAALHPSLRKTFEPVQPRAPRFGMPALLLCIMAALAGPLSLALLVRGHDFRDLGEVLVGGAMAPVLLAIYLVRQVRSRARAEHRAQHDPLTGLPNQTLFNDRVEVALAQCRRSGTGAAVMFLDLDRFKSINDGLGHAIGNELLQAVAKRLSATLRETDTVARMGGDEFTVLLHDAGRQEDVAVTAQKIIEQFSSPFVAGGRELHTTTSIGVAMYPADGEDVDTLLKHADSAMYRAKARGRDAFEFYTEDLSNRVQARLSVESALRQAVDRRGLELHYQPQVNLRTGAIVGLEALARWPHNRFGMIMPNVFIPVAEETGLIATLGDWAIDEACAELRRWINAGITPRPVAVNVSARQLAGTSLVAQVERTLQRHDIAPNLLQLEITESVFMRDLATSTETLTRLRNLGVGCAIDDFGTGFSGLSYLADLPIDSLKIDQSFVSPIRRRYDDAPIVEAIIGMASALHLNVVAEGVETDEQARFLAEHGCDEMQGYLFSPPQPADNVARLLTLDDSDMIDWRATSGVRLVAADAARPIVGSHASVLLAALCAGRTPEGRRDEIAALLAELTPREAKSTTPSAIRTASMRVAIGSFAGLVPITTGLAAAHVLPQPIQLAVASALNTAGLELAAGATTAHSNGTTLLADSHAETQKRSANSDVAPLIATTNDGSNARGRNPVGGGSGSPDSGGSPNTGGGSAGGGHPNTGGGNSNAGGGSAGGGNPKPGGNPNAGGGNPNAGGGNPNAGGGNPKPGGNPNAGGGNPNAGGGNPKSGGGKPNAGGGKTRSAGKAKATVK